MIEYCRFLKQNKRWLTGGFLLCFFSSFGQTFFISLSGGQIRAEYGLSNGEFGGLYMIATLASALTLPFLGRLVDRTTVSRTALVVMPSLATACLLMAWSESVLWLALSIYLLRLFGQGMMTHTSLTAMGRWFSSTRGRAVSLATLGHQTGEALLPLLMIALVTAVGWRFSWLIAAAILMLIALPCVSLLMRVERSPEPPSAAQAARQSEHWSRARVLRDPLFWIMLIGTLAPGFIGTTIFFHQAYRLELREWPPEAFARAFMAVASMTISFAILAGWLIDRFRSPRVLPVYLAPLSLACFALAGIEQSSGLFVFMALLGMSYGISSTLFGALWPEIYGTRHLGSVRSVTVSLMVFATALGPGITGVLIDNGISYLTQVNVMGIYCLSVSGVMIWVSRALVHRQQATDQ